MKKTLDDGVEIVRSRLVGRDFKMKGGGQPEQFFAATPPWEAKKLLFKMSMVNPKKGKLETKLMFIDVRKAHLIPVCNEKVFVELPDGRVVRLKKWLYGMRKAASSWEEFYTEKFVEKGFQPGSSCPVVFFNKETAVRVVVHGDDFTFSGHHLELVALRKWMESWCDIKFRGIMGSGRDDTKEIEILGRTLRRTNKGLELEASRNPRLKLLRDFGLNEDSKGLSCPVVQDKGKEEEGRVLCKHEASKFRGGVALMNFLGQDRPDVQFATKQASHKMATPTETDLPRLKRIARYLVEAERVVWHYPETDDEPGAVEVFVDSDWAGCLSTRKSTSGGVLSVAGTAMKSWSSTQGSVATSVAEAEYYAALKGAAEALGFASLARDLGHELKVILWSDSTAARGVAARKGLSSCTRHMEVKFLWLQGALAKGQLDWKKVHTYANPADVLTKPTAREEMRRRLALVGGELHATQSDRSLQARSEEGCR